MSFSAIISGLLAGFFGALGLGGGGVLVMFLTVFLGTAQLQAQGINLLFFIPVGLFALYFHIKQKLVVWPAAVPAIILGILGALVGSLLARYFGGDVIRRIFGLMLLLLGVHELFFPEGLKKKTSKK
jgi:uncharacterized membrane protein YfcA